MGLSSIDRRHAAWAFLGYLVFVVYGGLIPFEYRDHTLKEAIESFANIAYLDLGVGSRADSIANIVLYVPLAFLGCVWILGMRTAGIARYFALAPVFIFCLTVAVGVEFTQIFFAPRTVSINDLIAEILGTLGGILLWALGRSRIVQLWDAFAHGGRQSVLAVMAVYGLGYIILALFPYDFLISTKELSWRLGSDNLGWLIAANCDNWLRCGVRLVGDAMAIAPMGLLLVLVAPRTNLRHIFIAGFVFGLVLEGMQLFLASGVSQGLSAVMRGFGLLAGAAIGRLLLSTGAASLARIVSRATPFLILPYLVLLAALGGWFSTAWLPLGEALARLADVRFMPLYYHYFSTEPAAMASLLANSAMYAPVGLVFWARKTTRGPINRQGAFSAAMWAGCLALPIELGKLLVPPEHPDLTNLLIAAGAAAFTFALIRWIEHAPIGASVRGPARPMAPPDPKPETPAIDWPLPRPIAVFLGLPALLGVFLGLVNYPLGTPVLAALLLLYGALLWCWPLLWFFLIPALLPVLDLSQLTGRLPLDEFDLFVLVTLVVGYPRVSRINPRPWPNPLLPAALILLWMTWGLASASGLWFGLGIEDEITASSHSALESWLVGKGMLWALLLVPIIRRLPRNTTKSALHHLLGGLVAGLGILTLAVLWERHVFVGLGDMENIFRVTGTFASMHTGGGYIEAFIAFAFPALAVWVLIQKSWTLKALGIGLGMLASYAMLVTFSRGGYAGLAAGLLVVIVGAFRMRSAHPGRRWLALAGLTAVVLAFALPILSGGFAEQRLARSAADLSFRQAHWARALELMDDGVVAALTGMGFGRYPFIYLLKSTNPKPPGTYQVVREGNNPYLRLGSGEAAFLAQLVEVIPGMKYRLAARVRQYEGEGLLGLPLCEKALLYSFECVWNELKLGRLAAGWHLLSIDGDSGHLGRGGHWPHRNVKLFLYNPGGSAIDVDDVSLMAEDGRELIVNGDFSNGVERWLFVVDQDPAWHIDQQWVEMYFAQGLLGVLAMVVLLIAVFKVLVPRVLAGSRRATALSGALAGFLTVGLLGSTMDTARLLMLFYVGALCAGLLVQAKGPKKKRTLLQTGD